MEAVVDQSLALATIEEAIEDIKNGKLVIVVDDEDRENEGDFIGAAELITPETINFMATHGRGLICTPLTSERAEEMELTPMVRKNTDLHGTAFTVSIDYKKKGCSTGISAYDRATGIQALCDPSSRSDDYARPGHIFPLIACNGGVLRRSGHTEAAVDLARLAGLKPIGVLVEILNEDGTMARLPQLKILAKALDLKIITIKDLVAYRMKKERLIEERSRVAIDTKFGPFDLVAYAEKDSECIHLAIVKGEWEVGDSILTRVHSSNNSADLIASILLNHDEEFAKTLSALNEEGKGVFLLLRQSEKGDELLATLEKLKKQKTSGQKISPHPKNSESIVQRNIGIGAQILNSLGVRKMKLLTRNVERRFALKGYDLEIVDYIELK